MSDDMVKVVADNWNRPVKVIRRSSITDGP